MLDFVERILRMPRVVLTVMVLLIGAGYYSYVYVLPKEAFPAIDIPYFYISVSQTGVSPSDADRLLAKPVEDRIKDIDGLKNYSSTASKGHASVFLEFEVNADKDKAEQDIRAELDGVAADLPDDAREPTIHAIDIAGESTIYVSVYGDVPERTLVEKAKALRDELENIDLAQSVEISGARDEQLEVQIDLNRLEAYNLTAAQLFDALAKNNLVVAGGTLDSGQGAFSIEVPGLITTAEDVFNLPLKTDGDTVVTFGDVATITRTFEDATEYARVNGSPAITLGVVKNIGANVIDLSDQVREITTEYTADWPPGLQASFLLDQAQSTLELYSSLEAAVMTAVVLVLITCVATLGVVPAIMIGVSIPISFMIAFLVLNAIGMTINMMVMFGLVLAVGVLVDDPIVVVEYAERKLQEGVSKKQAFILAARKMFVPVVSATATTLGAFVPLLFWPGIIGKVMGFLPTVVIIVMIASLVSALIFMPVIGAIISNHKVDEKEKERADIVMYPDKFDMKKVGGVTGWYVRAMSHLMHHPFATLFVGFAFIIGTFWYYAENPTGSELFPASEPEYGTVSVVARGNYSPVEVRDMLIEVENEILNVNGIQDVIMRFGGGGSSPPNTIGNFQLQLLPWSERHPAAEIFQDIRDRTANISGLEVQIAEMENGPPSGKDINLRLESVRYDDLAPAVAKLRDYVENDLGGVIDVEDGRPAPGIDWQITIDRAAAAKYGVGVRELSPYVQLITSGVTIGTYRPDDATDELDIKVRLPQEERTFDALDTMRIATTAGLVPVSNFIERKAVRKVASISRYNGLYSMSFGANVTGIDPETGEAWLPSKKVDMIQDWEKAGNLPDGVTIAFGGMEEMMGDTNTFIVQAFAGAMFLIFLILLMEYQSFYQVFVTLSTVIMSLAGVLLGMLVSGMTFSAVMTGLGIVALTGIVVKNGIVLIDTYNHYNRDDGVEPVKAMLLTVAQRIRPVLLTASVTALGVIPMAVNIEFNFIAREIVVGGIAGSWFVYLSAALVSGLFVSTMLTLVMVPVMITAPSVVWASMRRNVVRIRQILYAPFRRRSAVTPEGVEMDLPEDAVATPVETDIPADVDSAAKYLEADRTGLVETDQDGVIVVSRQAAE